MGANDPLPWGATEPDDCAKAAKLKCTGCGLVYYCNTARCRATHRDEHGPLCLKVQASRLIVEAEEAKLLVRPEDIPSTYAGRFWSTPATRSYIRARFAAAQVLLEFSFITTFELAYDQFTEILRLCPSDELGVKDIIAFLLMDLDREQDCYDFLKSWAMTSNRRGYNYTQTALPGIHMANPLEGIQFLSKDLSLSQLVAFTLLKLRLGSDLEYFDDPVEKYAYFHLYDDERRFDRRRYVDSLVGKMIEDDGSMDIAQKHQELTSQYLTLMQWVHDANPYFWPAFSNINIDKPVQDQPERVQPRNFRNPKEEEAAEVLRQCKSAWQHSGLICIAKPIVSRLIAKNGSPGLVNTLEKRRGVGKVLPSRFQTPQHTSDPATLFDEAHLPSHHVYRFVQEGDHSIALAYVDGACSNNGMQNPRAGWAVVYSPRIALALSGRLEMKGPFGEPSVATSNRAELRASIAALRLPHWRKEGFETLVIATDSTYVVDGATQWIKSWLRKGWWKSSGERVKNRDLWEMLLGEVERWHDQGLKVEFWRIPRELNTKADKAAKDAVNENTVNSEFQDPVV